MDNVLWATLTIGYNNCSPTFKFECASPGSPLKLVTAEIIQQHIARQTQGVCPSRWPSQRQTREGRYNSDVQLTFDNDIPENEYAIRACTTDEPIPILVSKDAKFDKLHVFGLIGTDWFETTLDSIDSMVPVLADFDRKTRYLKIFKHAKDLTFEIL